MVLPGAFEGARRDDANQTRGWKIKMKYGIYAVLLLALAFAALAGPAAALSPDFSLTIKPSSLSITDPPIGQSINTATSTLTIKSTNGFSGSVSLTYVPVFADMTQGPLLSFSTNPVTLSSGQSVKDTVTVMVCQTTPNGTYNFNITGTSSPLQHSVALTVNVSGAHSGTCPV